MSAEGFTCTQAVGVANHADLERTEKYLIADIAAACATLGSRQRIFERVFVTYSMSQLCLIKAHLRGLGYMVPVGQRPRKQDLIAAIVSAGELTATGPTVSKRTRKDICSSASAAARAPTVSKPAASSSAGVAEQPGLRAEGRARAALSRAPGQQSSLRLAQC